jgi:hypothetical protein
MRRVIPSLADDTDLPLETAVELSNWLAEPLLRQLAGTQYTQLAADNQGQGQDRRDHAAGNLVPAAATRLHHCSAFSSLASGCSRVCPGTCLGGSTNRSASCSHFQQCASCAVYGLSSAIFVGHMHGRPAPRGPSGSISSCRHHHHHHHALYIKLLIQAIATPSAPRPTTSSYEATAAQILGRAAAKYATQQCGIERQQKWWCSLLSLSSLRP